MFSSINTCWTLVGAFLVYFMQAGFALCEAGFTRAKNTGNILMKNMMDFCIGTPCYWIIGFGLMFGGTGALIGGFDPFIQGDYSHLCLFSPSLFRLLPEHTEKYVQLSHLRFPLFPKPDQISLQVRYKPIRFHRFHEPLLRNPHLCLRKYDIPHWQLLLWKPDPDHP